MRRCNEIRSLPEAKAARLGAWPRMSVTAMAAMAAVVLMVCQPASAEPSQSQRLAFQKYSSCPSTGRRVGACPGYRMAYRVPPCAGGQDAWTNIVWVAESEVPARLRSEATACAARGK